MYSIKPMAISSITSPLLPKASLAKYRYDPSDAAPSPPESPTYEKSTRSHHHRQNLPTHYTTSEDVNHPLSLQERRQRNKTASAKYRAKKNQQYGEMRSLIMALTKENDLLERQLNHIQLENTRLKATCDQLRGKMLAKKMLKKLLNSKEELFDQEEDQDDITMTTDEESDTQALFE